MAVVLDAFVGVLMRKLGDLAVENIGQVLGVKKELNTLQSNMKWIETIIHDSRSRGRARDGVSKLYRDELTDWMYDAEDIIELCAMEGGKLLEGRYTPSSSLLVRNSSMAFSCFGSLPFRHKIGSKIKDLNARLDQITKNKSRFIGEGSKLDSQPSRVIDRETTPLITRNEFVGSEIENDTKELVNFITKENKERISIVAICGMGGIGKSTLAKKLYNDPRIVNAFDVKAWVFVSPNCTNVDVLKKTIEHINGYRPKLESKTIMQQILVSKIEGKSFFLVLDDIWSADVWENALKAPFDKAARGTILLTTRDINIAERMRAHVKSIKPLSINSGWELLRKSAYLIDEDEVESLRDIGNKIVSKCQGLPLAIKVIGGVLSGKECILREWEMILNSDTWMNQKEFEGALLLSYEDLSPQLQQCFLYFSLEHKEVSARVDIINYWVAEGFIQEQGNMIVEEVAGCYYNELIRRNLLGPNEMVDENDACRMHEACRMHDLLRHLACSLMEGHTLHCSDSRKLLNTNISKLRRLSLLGGDPKIAIPSRNNEKLRLRTFFLYKCPLKLEFHMFERLESLRILILNTGGIETVPESLQKLKFLRMLDLDRTFTRNLPESISSLINLQILSIAECKFLERLPRGFTKLCNLRYLNVCYTPLKCVPRGLGGLKQLNRLEGFIVATSSSQKQENDGWELKELEPLDNLRCLRIENLERQVSGVQVIKEKFHLRELHLYCTPPNGREYGKPNTEEEFSYMEKTFQNMSPPSCLELLYMRFFGRQYPNWLEDLLHLTQLVLVDCISTPILPPLGQLPKLKVLKIINACAVVSIGSEFLGNGPIAFKKLEHLTLEKMPNWEMWSLTTKQIKQHDVAQLGVVGAFCSSSLFPCLDRLQIRKCPKLNALPDELNQATNMQQLEIDEADSLHTVKNIPSVSELIIFECPILEKVSDFPQLRELRLYGCPNFRCIENIDRVQDLSITCCNTECLPQGLSELLTVRQHLDDANTELFLNCSLELFTRCLEGGEYWPIVQLFSIASINYYHGQNTFVFIEYDKLARTYKTNYSEVFPSK